jgi:transcriptional regulator with XRE-family HTH domain
MCAPLQKQLALALGCSEKWASELCRGNPTADRFVATLERLARHRATDAAPLAVLPLTVIPRILAEHVSDDDLDPLLDAALEAEGAREAVENQKTLVAVLGRNGDPETVAAQERELVRALIGSLAAQATLVGVLLERRRRREERSRAH